jgi:RimJ/RimL family protein N-acetyltransferase
MSRNMSKKPIGPIVDPLPPGTVPDLRPIHGRWMRLDPVQVERHATSLFSAIDGKDPEGHLWTYMAYGPFGSAEVFSSWLKEKQAARDPWFYAFVNRSTGEALGMGSFMRADAANGAIEIGNIWLAPALQRTREGTEAVYLMMRHCFDDLGVRRLEWKCDALNATSRRSALRYGFTFEGIFRQHFIIKGRNRDTAWFSMLDKEWPEIRKGFEVWLAEDNFDKNGVEKAKLRVR